MTLSPKVLNSLLLLVLLGLSARGQTVIDDFEIGFDNFLHFGNATIDSGLLEDCETIGNHCNTHTVNFTENPASPHDFGIGELGPFIAPETIDLDPFIGYSIDARFIRTGISDPNAGQEDFTGLSPIKFGVQWDPNDSCGSSMNACSDLYDEPVMLTESFQTFTVMFDDFLMGKPRSSAQIKMLMLGGDFDPNGAPPRQLESADFNADSQVSGEDFLTWQLHAGESGGGFAVRFDHGNANIGIPGSTTLTEINGEDLAIWEAQYGTLGGPIGDWSDGVGRLEIDNIIGILPPSLSVVPEPTSCCLILCGASLLSCWSSWRKREIPYRGQRCRAGQRGAIGTNFTIAVFLRRLLRDCTL